MMADTNIENRIADKISKDVLKATRDSVANLEAVFSAEELSRDSNLFLGMSLAYAKVINNLTSALYGAAIKGFGGDSGKAESLAEVLLLVGKISAQAGIDEINNTNLGRAPTKGRVKEQI